MVGHGVCLVEPGIFCMIASLVSYEIEHHSSMCQNEQTLIACSSIKGIRIHWPPARDR